MTPELQERPVRAHQILKQATEIAKKEGVEVSPSSLPAFVESTIERAHHIALATAIEMVLRAEEEREAWKEQCRLAARRHHLQNRLAHRSAALGQVKGTIALLENGFKAFNRISNKEIARLRRDLLVGVPLATAAGTLVGIVGEHFGGLL